MLFFFPKFQSLCKYHMMITSYCFVKICITNCSQLYKSQYHLCHCQFLKHLCVFTIQANKASFDIIVLHAVFPIDKELQRNSHFIKTKFATKLLPFTGVVFSCCFLKYGVTDLIVWPLISCRFLIGQQPSAEYIYLVKFMSVSFLISPLKLG